MAEEAEKQEQARWKEKLSTLDKVMKHMEGDVHGMGRALKKEEHDFMARNPEYVHKIVEKGREEDQIIIRDTTLDYDDERYIISKVEKSFELPSPRSEDKYAQDLKGKLRNKFTTKMLKKKTLDAMCNIYDQVRDRYDAAYV